MFYKEYIALRAQYKHAMIILASNPEYYIYSEYESVIDNLLLQLKGVKVSHTHHNSPTGKPFHGIIFDKTELDYNMRRLLDYPLPVILKGI